MNKGFSILKSVVNAVGSLAGSVGIVNDEGGKIFVVKQGYEHYSI